MIISSTQSMSTYKRSLLLGTVSMDKLAIAGSREHHMAALANAPGSCGVLARTYSSPAPAAFVKPRLARRFQQQRRSHDRIACMASKWLACKDMHATCSSSCQDLAGPTTNTSTASSTATAATTTTAATAAGETQASQISPAASSQLFQPVGRAAAPVAAAAAAAADEADLAAELAAHCGYQFVRLLPDASMFGPTRALTARCDRTNRLRTLLLIPRQQLAALEPQQQQGLVTQLQLASSLHHPHMLQVQEVFAGPLHLVIVLEECSSGRLLDLPVQQQQAGLWGAAAAAAGAVPAAPAAAAAAESDCAGQAAAALMSPDLARWYLQQLVLALQYSHARGVAGLAIEHAVLKAAPGLAQPVVKLPTKLMAHGLAALQQPQAAAAAACTDRGLGSRSTTTSTTSSSSSSEWAFTAPECRIACAPAAAVTAPGDDDGDSFKALAAADMWGCGQLLLKLLGGQEGQLQDTTQLQQWEQQAPGLGVLLTGLLHEDPLQRYTLADVLRSPFYVQQLPAAAAALADRYLQKPRVCRQPAGEIRAAVLAACAAAPTAASSPHGFVLQLGLYLRQQQQQQQRGGVSVVLSEVAISPDIAPRLCLQLHALQAIDRQLAALGASATAGAVPVGVRIMQHRVQQLAHRISKALVALAGPHSTQLQPAVRPQSQQREEPAQTSPELLLLLHQAAAELVFHSSRMLEHGTALARASSTNCAQQPPTTARCLRSSFPVLASTQDLVQRLQLQFPADTIQPARALDGNMSCEAVGTGSSNLPGEQQALQLVGVASLFRPQQLQQDLKQTDRAANAAPAAPAATEAAQATPAEGCMQLPNFLAHVWPVARSPQAAVELVGTLQQLQAAQHWVCSSGVSSGGSSSAELLSPVEGMCLEPPLLVLPRPACGTLAQWISSTAGSISRSGAKDLTAAWASSMPWPLLLQLLGDVAAGLSLLHEQQPVVVHGGVHAAAVNLLQQLPVAAPCGPAIQQPGMTQAGSTATTGTRARVGQLSLGSLLTKLSPVASCHPFLASPEVLLGSGPASPAADVYGFGVLMYQLASGWLPQHYTPGSDDQISAVLWTRNMVAQAGSTSVLAAAAAMGASPAPCIGTWTPYGRHMLSSAALQQLPAGYFDLMQQCLLGAPAARPSMAAVTGVLQGMLTVHVAVARGAAVGAAASEAAFAESSAESLTNMASAAQLRRPLVLHCCGAGLQGNSAGGTAQLGVCGAGEQQPRRVHSAACAGQGACSSLPEAHRASMCSHDPLAQTLQQQQQQQQQLAGSHCCVQGQQGQEDISRTAFTVSTANKEPQGLTVASSPGAGSSACTSVLHVTGSMLQRLKHRCVAAKGWLCGHLCPEPHAKHSRVMASAAASAAGASARADAVAVPCREVPWTMKCRQLLVRHCDQAMAPLLQLPVVCVAGSLAPLARGLSSAVG